MEYKSTRQIRRENLQELLKTFTRVYLKNELDIAQTSFFSRLISEKPDTQKFIGDDLARKIEIATGKPENWLDNCHDPCEELRHALIKRIKKLPPKLAKEVNNYLNKLLSGAIIEKVNALPLNLIEKIDVFIDGALAMDSNAETSGDVMQDESANLNNEEVDSFFYSESKGPEDNEDHQFFSEKGRSSKRKKSG